MSIWYCIPSIRPNGGTIPIWRQMGYKVACLRQGDLIECELQIPTGEYKGWAPSVNILAKWVIENDPTAEWIVTGGDDYEPDMSRRPEDIAAECNAHFLDLAWPKCWHWAAGYKSHVEALAAGAYAEQKKQSLWSAPNADIYSHFGVMQPTGDRWGDTPAARRQYGENCGAYIDRIAGSPWMGREWCKRAYGGNGPMHAGYRHMYADEELKEVAEKLGVYWPRRDIVQLHKHWGRIASEEFGDIKDCPDFLMPVNTPQHWHESQRLFVERKSAGWPGHEPLDIAIH